MMAKLFHTSDLNGLTGDNGENWCLFVRNVENPLASGWKWFFEEDNARMWAKDWGIKIKLGGDNVTKQLGYLGIDQWGNHFNLEKHPRKELMEQLGYNSCSKMYVDTKDEKVKHVGYVIGNHWINVYRVFEWKDAE